MEYGEKTSCSHMKFIQNKGKSLLILGLCRNLAKGIKRNNVGCYLSSEYIILILNNWALATLIEVVESSPFRGGAFV